MRCADIPTTRELADQLLAYEEVENGSDNHAAVRVCDKLRRPLAKLAGVAGFGSLLVRALSDAKQESPALGTWKVRPDAFLQVIHGEAEQSGASLIAHLLGLLIALVGESFAVQILNDVWPSLPNTESRLKRKEPE